MHFEQASQVTLSRSIYHSETPLWGPSRSGPKTSEPSLPMGSRTERKGKAVGVPGDPTSCDPTTEGRQETRVCW